MEEDWGQGDEIITPAPSTASPASAQATPQADPGLLSTKGGRLGQGMLEPLIGGAQTFAHIAATEPGKFALGALLPGLQAVPTGNMKEMARDADTLAQGAADLYAKSRAEAGIAPDEWDYWAGLGNILTPANYFPGSATGKAVTPAASMTKRIAYRLGRYLPGSFASEIDQLTLPATEKIGLLNRFGKLATRGAVGGATFGSQQPVADLGSDETFAERKALQTGIGGMFGAVAEPVMTGAVNTAIRAGRQLFPSGRTKAAAERLGDILTERGENPETLRAAMETPGAQGTVAERTGSPTMAGVEQRLEVDDPVFAQNLERQRAETREGIESGAEQAIGGGDPMLVREASLQAKANTDEAMGMLKDSVKAKHEKELADLQGKLDLARQNVSIATQNTQNNMRGKLGKRSGELTEQEAAAQTQYERVSTALDEMIADAEKRAQEASSAFGGSGPEDRRLANMAEAETQRSIKDELKSIERNSWSSAIDEHGHKPVENTAPFLDSLLKSDEIMHVRKYPSEAKAIIDSWKEAIESGEPIPLKKAQNDRSFILELGREARTGANPDLRFASAAKELAEGIYEAMASVPGLETPRAITRAIKERYGQTYAGELARVGSAGAPAIAPELTLEKAISGGGAGAAMRMRQLEEAATPLTIEPPSAAPAPKVATAKPAKPASTSASIERTVLSSDRTAEVRANQERFLRIYAEKLIDPATGRLSPNKTDVFLRDNKDLMQRFPGLANDLQTASNAAREAKESVTRAKVGKSKQKAELAKTLDGIQSERSAIKKAAFDQLVSVNTGLINPNKVENYLRDNFDVINKYQGLREEIKKLAEKTKTLAEVEADVVPEVRGKERAYKERLAEIQSSQDKIDKRAYAKFAKADDPMSVVRESFKSDDILSRLEDMAQSVKGGPKGTTAGLRRLIFDHGIEQSTKGEKLDFQKLYDFYFKPVGAHGASVTDILRAKGAMKESQVNGLKSMLKKGVEHQNYRRNAHVIPEISTPLGAMLDAVFRQFGAHYGARLTPGSGIHGAAAGSKLARNIINMPARRMSDLLKQALEEPELMKALLSKATRKNESELNTIIRRSLIRGGILSGMDISKTRPDSPAYQ